MVLLTLQINLPVSFEPLGRSAINTLEIGIQGLSTIILSDDSVFGYNQKEQEDQVEDRQASGVLERLNAAKLTGEAVKTAFQKTHLQYDRQGDEHYNLISALHKSVRGGYVDLFVVHIAYNNLRQKKKVCAPNQLELGPIGMRMRRSIGWGGCLCLARNRCTLPGD